MEQASALVLLGPTGSGKTPLGDRLAELGLNGLAVRHFDFGAALRAAAQDASGAAHLAEADIKVIRGVLERGALLEDSQYYIAEAILRGFMEEAREQAESFIVVLNGLPRHVGQARDLERLVQVTGVVALRCSDEVVLERIARNTGGDRVARDDDAREAVLRRLAIYRERTDVLTQHYREQGAAIHELQVGVETKPDDMVAMLSERWG